MTIGTDDEGSACMTDVPVNERAAGIESRIAALSPRQRALLEARAARLVT